MINYSLKIFTQPIIIIVLSLLMSPLGFADSHTKEYVIYDFKLDKEIAKLFVSLEKRIEYCNSQKIKFRLKPKDKPFIQQYANQFFVNVAVLSVVNADKCSAAAEQKLAKKFDLVRKKLALLGINPDDYLILKKPYAFIASNDPQKKLSAQPKDLQAYVKKRVGNQIYDLSDLLDLIEQKNTIIKRD